MKSVIAIIILTVFTVVGVRFQSPPYRLDHITQPNDQQALAHRDSAYSSSTWIASPGENFFQLRFFDRVEGGVCLHPSWAELRALAEKDPRLAHLTGPNPPAPMPGEKTWTYPWLPDPGTLPHTKYVNLFPAGILLNRQLMAAADAAAPNDPESWRKAKPNILVVGLGSGVGIAVFAHHFPDASITVVDIDQVVIELVRDHYPLLQWLEGQKTADGRQRLRLVTRDARQFIRAHDPVGSEKYDLIVLDAYTSGSTIPPHLMTTEFYRECALALTDGGLVMSNIIGSYDPAPTDNKHLVLGGAVLSQQKAGLTHVHNIPILVAPGAFEPGQTRNNMLISSAQPFGPREAKPLWERLRTFVPFPELKRGDPAYTTTCITLVEGSGFNAKYSSATVPLEFVRETSAGWFAQLAPKDSGRSFSDQGGSAERAMIAKVAESVTTACSKAGIALPRGWEKAESSDSVLIIRTDWVHHSRAVWAAAIGIALDASTHSGEEMLKRIANVPEFTDARPNADIYND